MSVITLLLPLSMSLTLMFVFAFLWVIKSGQYDDLETPQNRILIDEEDLDITPSESRHLNPKG